MYPAQTSLIPVSVAISRFVEVNGYQSGIYPYWYLGVPLKYLMGPVVPTFMVLIHKLFPGLAFFDLSFLFIFASLFGSAIAWGALTERLSGNKKIGIMTTLALLIFPWRYLSSLALDEVSFVVARCILPFVFLSFWQFLKLTNVKWGIVTVLSLVILFLTNTSVAPMLFIGMVAIVFTKSAVETQEENMKIRAFSISLNFKLSVVVLLTSLVVVTLWYTPSYWFTIIANPSIGGVSGIKVIFRIIDLLKASLPVFLAVFAVYFAYRLKRRLSVFILVWTLSFVFLTAFRFIGDPDFWQDWTSWFFEVEVGIAVLLSTIIFTRKITLPHLLFLITPFLLSIHIYRVLGSPVLMSPTLPRGVSSLQEVANIAGQERVFLSGSSVFWANALYDIYQVRGGRDQVATHPTWDQAAYELREGVSGVKTKKWLEELGISYVLVHGPDSSEFYHDFKNVRKWETVGEIIWEGQGDKLYRIPKF